MDTKWMEVLIHTSLEEYRNAPDIQLKEIREKVTDRIRKKFAKRISEMLNHISMEVNRVIEREREEV